MMFMVFIRVKPTLLVTHHLQKIQLVFVRIGYFIFNRPNSKRKVDYIACEYNQSVILAHDFAVRGDQVQGVEEQVRDVFLPNAGQKPSWAPWSGNKSLFSALDFVFRRLIFSYMDWY